MLPTGSPRPTSYAPSRKFPPTPSQGIRGNSLSNNRKALFCGSLALGRRFGGFALGGSPFGLSGGSGFGSLLLGDRLRTLLLHLGLGSQTCLLGSLGVGGELRLLRSDLAQLLLHPLVELGLGIRLRESTLGYTAQQVLDYAQTLYEKKLLTYPRTDSNYLTEDMKDTIPGLCDMAASIVPFTVPAFDRDISRVIDSSKVSDHHALLPTKQAASADLVSLPAGERNILTLVMARLLTAVAPKHIYEDTSAVLECGGTSFTAKGRVITSAGFKELEQAFFATLKKKPEDDTKEDAGVLPPLTDGQTFEKVKASAKEGTTSPPKHFTEDLLLSAMEHASAAEFAEIGDVERTGLGTPATRAGVLEKLVRGGFLERKGKQLLPTKKGFNLIVVLPDAIKSAHLTAQWEAELKAVERGEQEPAVFLGGIEKLISDLVAQYHAISADTSMFQQREAIGKCPRCGSDVVEGKKNFYCTNRECQFSMWKDDRFFTSKHKELTKPMAAALLKNGRIKMKGLFSEKKGVLYDAVVVLADTGDKYVNYKIELPPRQNKNGKE